MSCEKRAQAQSASFRQVSLVSTDYRKTQTTFPSTIWKEGPRRYKIGQNRQSFFTGAERVSERPLHQTTNRGVGKSLSVCIWQVRARQDKQWGGEELKFHRLCHSSHRFFNPTSLAALQDRAREVFLELVVEIVVASFNNPLVPPSHRIFFHRRKTNKQSITRPLRPEWNHRLA